MTSPSGRPIRIAVESSYDNSSQEVIITTSDKLKLVLIDHVAKVEDSKSWHTPCSLVVGIILVFCSADFKLAFGIPADTWRAIFIISLILCTWWLFSSLFKISKRPTIDQIIKKIKNTG